MSLSIKKPRTKSQKTSKEKIVHQMDAPTGPSSWTEIVQDAQSGLLALSVRVGLQTL